jgi:hypothetical protein
MGDPVSIAISLGLTAAGGIMGAQGASKQAAAQAQAAQYKAAVARANQKIAAQNAQYEMQLGGVEEQRVGLAGGQQMGQLTSHLAGSGFQLGSRTSQDVLASQQAGIQTAEATTMADAAKRAFGYRVQGMGYGAEGTLDTMSAEAAKTAGQYGVAESLLGGATGVADKWQKYKTAGVGSDSSGFGNIFSGMTWPGLGG